MRKIREFYTDKAFGDIDVFKVAITIWAGLSLIFIIIAITSRSYEYDPCEDQWHGGHKHVVCQDGNVSGKSWGTFNTREHAIDCPHESHKEVRP